MAPIATLVGGFFGTLATLVAVAFFGAGFWEAVSVYFTTSLSVVAVLLAGALLQQSGQVVFQAFEAREANLQRET